LLHGLDGKETAWATRSGDSAVSSSDSIAASSVYQPPEQAVHGAENPVLPNLNDIFYTDANIQAADGGSGYDTLILYDPSTPDFFINFAIVAVGTFENLEAIELGPNPGGNSAKLDIAAVFNMTDSDNILDVFADANTAGSSVVVTMAGAGAPGFNLDSVVVNGSTTTTTYAETYLGDFVTLVINSNNVSVFGAVAIFET